MLLYITHSTQQQYLLVHMNHYRHNKSEPSTQGTSDGQTYMFITAYNRDIDTIYINTNFLIINNVCSSLELLKIIFCCEFNTNKINS